MSERAFASRRPVARGLRTKIVVRFTTVAVVLSILLGTITYLTVRQVLMDDRKANAVQQVARDSRMLAALGVSSSSNPSAILVSLRPPTRSTPLLLSDGRWFAASLQVRPEDLPVDLVAMVEEGTPARQTVRLRGVPMLVVGVPIGSDSYFEVMSLADIDSTLLTLSRVLTSAGLITTAVGAALAAWISARVLRPLREIAVVASQIADGALESRLDGSLDRDLAALTDAFNRMADSLQSRIAREARFASDVAHELRTPLTTLLTTLSVLEGRRDELSTQGQEALGLLATDVRRLERTAADLIEIAKLDAGVDTVELEPLPVSSVIGGVLSRLRRSDIPVDIDRTAARKLIRVDQRRLERVLANLIDNADTHGEGVHRLVVEGTGDVVRIAVEDHGPGVPEEESERIFERFARGSHQAAPPGGSGLGLALAFENTRVQGGRIWVEPVSGGGARFVVELEAEPG